MCADAYLYDLAPLYGPIARLQEPHGTYRQHPDRNFGARPFDERLPKSAFVHELLIPRLAERCRELGIQPDERSWAQRSWPLRSFRALTDIDGLVPSSTPFVLVDDGKLGVNATPTRRLIPFPPSPSDDVALAELERLRPAGAEFLVVAWPAFSWFDQPRLARHLRSSHRLVLENEQVIAFALGALGAPRPRRG